MSRTEFLKYTYSEKQRDQNQVLSNLMNRNLKDSIIIEDLL